MTESTVGTAHAARGESLRESAAHLVFRLLDTLYYLGRRRPDHRAILGPALDALPPGAWVLDFGSGPGGVAAALGGGPPRIALADVDPCALAEVPAALRPRRVLIPGRPPLPFRDGSLDIVLVIDVLHHVPAAEDTLRALAAELRPGGELYIVEFRKGRGLARLFEGVNRLLGRGCRFFTPEELTAILGPLGLAAEVQVLDGFRYAVRARRVRGDSGG